MIKKIKDKLKSPTSKGLISNFIYLSILQILNYLFPLITLPYLSRVLGVANFGVIALATAIISYFIAFVDFGFNYTAVRDIAKCRDNISKVSEIFNTVMYSRMILLIISFIILFILIQIVPIFKNNSRVIYYTFLIIPGNILLPQWFFQAMEKMKFIAILSFISKLIFTGLIFVVIKTDADYIYQPILIATGNAISGIIAMYIILKQFKIRLVIPPLKNIYDITKNSWNMFICIFFPNLYNSISILFLGQFSGKTEIGIFDGGNRFIGISQQVTNIISRVFYPFLSRRIDKHKLYNYILGLISLFMSVALFFGAELIVKIFYTEEFNDSIYVIKLMSITPILMYLNDVYGTNYLVLIKKDNILRNIIIFSSILGLFLSYFLILKYGYLGVCFTLISVRGIMGTITFIYARKYKILNK